jgi:hypothetical protein
MGMFEDADAEQALERAWERRQAEAHERSADLMDELVTRMAGEFAASAAVRGIPRVAVLHEGKTTDGWVVVLSHDDIDHRMTDSLVVLPDGRWFRAELRSIKSRFGGRTKGSAWVPSSRSVRHVFSLGEVENSFKSRVRNFLTLGQ